MLDVIAIHERAKKAATATAARLYPFGPERVKKERELTAEYYLQMVHPNASR